MLADILEEHGYHDVLCIVPRLANVSCSMRASPARVQRLLGTEYDAVIIAARELLRPNLLAASTEMVRAGGVLALIVPPLEEWRPGGQYTTNTYRDYLVSSFQKMEAIFWADLDKAIVYRSRLPGKAVMEYWDPSSYKSSNHLPRALIEAAANEEQARLLDEAVGFLRRRGKTIVVVGDRGRGKSGLLALIVAYLVLTRRVGFVAVTAPSPYAMSSFFRILSRALTKAEIGHWSIRRGEAVIGIAGPWFHIRYHTPDALEPGSYTVVDEAAAIGPLRLRRIARKAPRLLVSTTVHGYEGSGKTFTKIVLETLPEPKIVLEPTNPIRYPKGDPLESWLYKTFLLDVEPPEPTFQLETKPRFVTLDRRKLIHDHDMLRSVYAVVSQAHYRNEPDDLAIMIDAPHHTLHALIVNESVVAAAEVAWDDCSLDRSARIVVDLMAQRFGYEETCLLRGARIVRIAVHPKLQRKGYGSFLLSRLEEWAREQGLDWLAAVFGRVEITRFWLKNGYRVIHVSPLPNKVTGEKNIAVAKPLTKKARVFIEKLAWALRYQLLLTASTLQRDIPAETMTAMLQAKLELQDDQNDESFIYLMDDQIHRLKAVLRGELDFESAIDALYASIINLVMVKGFLPLQGPQAIATTARILQGKNIDDTAAALGVNREDVRKILREAAREIASIVLREKLNKVSR